MLTLALVASACSAEPQVTINREEPRISHSILGDKSLATSNEGSSKFKASENDNLGQTDWVFRCKPKMHYTILSTRQTNGTHTVRIGINKIVLDLGLDIDVRVIPGATLEVVDHEQGHVNICKRVYEHAGEVARELAQSVLDTPFQADGATANAARDAALQQASDRLCQQYTIRTLAAVNSVSRMYDDFADHVSDRRPSQELVKEAFEESKTDYFDKTN